MFEAGVPLTTSPELRDAGERAFAVLRGAAEKICAQVTGPLRPPALMVALHIWAMSHGIASLFGRGDAARRPLPMTPEELLEAEVLIYLRGSGGGEQNRAPADANGILDSRLDTKADVNVIYIHTGGHMSSCKLDELGNRWIALMILGFIAWWPLGLRCPCLYDRERTDGLRYGMLESSLQRLPRARRHQPLAVEDAMMQDRWQSKIERMQGKMDRMRSRMERPRNGGDWRISGDRRDRAAIAPSTSIVNKLCSGSKRNNASSGNFWSGCASPRTASEFDQFMTERRNRPRRRRSRNRRQPEH